MYKIIYANIQDKITDWYRSSIVWIKTDEPLNYYIYHSHAL